MRERCSRVLLMGLASLLSASCARGETKVLVDRESQYNHIRVVDEDGVRRLLFRSEGYDYVESAIDLENPLRLRMKYYPLMLAALAHQPQPERILFLGLGGGTLPRVLRHYYPKARVDSIDIDPAVVEVAKKYFGVEEDDRTEIFVRDGREQFRELARQGRNYDLVFLDAYGGGYIPRHLTTGEFLELVKKVLTDGGLVVANLQPGLDSYHAQRRTMAAVFRNQWSYGSGGNVIVVADSRRNPPSKDALVQAARRLQKEKQLTFDLPEVVEEGGMRNDYQRQGPILTDENAPEE